MLLQCSRGFTGAADSCYLRTHIFPCHAAQIKCKCFYSCLQEAAKGLESGQLTDATAALFFEQKKDQITDSLWKLNVLDIESTLSRVVDRVGFWSTLQPHAVCPACKSIQSQT